MCQANHGPDPVRQRTLPSSPSDKSSLRHRSLCPRGQAGNCTPCTAACNHTQPVHRLRVGRPRVSEVRNPPAAHRSMTFLGNGCMAGDHFHADLLGQQPPSCPHVFPAPRVAGRLQSGGHVGVACSRAPGHSGEPRWLHGRGLVCLCSYTQPVIRLRVCRTRCSLRHAHTGKRETEGGREPQVRAHPPKKKTRKEEREGVCPYRRRAHESATSCDRPSECLRCHFYSLLFSLPFSFLSFSFLSDAALPSPLATHLLTQDVAPPDPARAPSSRGSWVRA